MEFSRELLFFFSALGAFNGLMLGFYFLFFAKPKPLSNYFLGSLFVALSIRVGKSVFFYFNPDLAGIYLQIGLTACFFIGPFLYFYIKAVVASPQKVLREAMYHFAILVPLVTILGCLYSVETHPDIWWSYFLNAIYIQWLGYLLLSAYYLSPMWKKRIQTKQKLNKQEVWTNSLFIGITMIWIAYMSCSYTSYILGALSFSLLFYFLVLLLILQRGEGSVIAEKTPPKYADKKINAGEAAQLFQQLEQLMHHEKLYRNASLKLPHVAEKMNILPHRLSQLLNDNAGKNFPAYINEYRIRAAQEMLLTESNYSLEGIGYECGFNSSSTFYATFKKYTGTTPAKYKNSLN